MLKGQVIVLFLVGIVVAATGGKGAGSQQIHTELVAQAVPSYIPWYTLPPSPDPWPTPITGANAGIEGAFAAGNIYNSGAGGTGSQPGIGIINTGVCNFLCFGQPGTSSARVFVFGNDYDPNNGGTSYTDIGAANACSPHCPGGITNQTLGISIHASPPAPSPTPINSGHFLALDGYGNLGIANNVSAAYAVIAGAGNGDPSSAPSYPPPSPGSLVSHTGTGQGDVLLGDSGNYVKCDYGETTTGSLTCGAPVWSAVSTSSSAGPVPPCYQSAGTSCNSTFHIAKNVSDLNIEPSASCLNNTWCTLSNNVISLSSTAVFVDGYYACGLSSSSSLKLTLTVNAQTGSSFAIQVYNNSGGSIVAGTDLNINYMCSGD